MGLIEDLNIQEFKSCIHNLLIDSKIYNKNAKNCFGLIDGHGATKIAKKFLIS